MQRLHIDEKTRVKLFAEGLLSSLSTDSVVYLGGGQLADLVPVYGDQTFATVRAALNANSKLETVAFYGKQPDYFSLDQWNQLLIFLLTKPGITQVFFSGHHAQKETEAVLVDGIKRRRPPLKYLGLNEMKDADVYRIVQSLGDETKFESFHCRSHPARVYELIQFLLARMPNLRNIDFGYLQQIDKKNILLLINFLENSNQLLELDINPGVFKLMDVMQKMLQFNREDAAVVAPAEDMPPTLTRAIYYFKKILPKSQECKFQTLMDESKRPFIAISKPNARDVFEACVEHINQFEQWGVKKPLLEDIEIDGVPYVRVNFPKIMAARIAVDEANLIEEINSHVDGHAKSSPLRALSLIQPPTPTAALAAAALASAGGATATIARPPSRKPRHFTFGL